MNNRHHIYLKGFFFLAHSSVSQTQGSAPLNSTLHNGASFSRLCVDVWMCKSGCVCAIKNNPVCVTLPKGVSMLHLMVSFVLHCNFNAIFLHWCYLIPEQYNIPLINRWGLGYGDVWKFMVTRLPDINSPRIWLWKGPCIADALL